MNGTLEHLLFHDQGLVFNTVLLRIVHVVGCRGFCSLFIAESYFIIWPSYDRTLFIRSPVDGCLDCFQFLAIMKKTAVNILEQILLGAHTYFSWVESWWWSR